MNEERGRFLTEVNRRAAYASMMEATRFLHEEIRRLFDEVAPPPSWRVLERALSPQTEHRYAAERLVAGIDILDATEMPWDFLDMAWPDEFRYVMPAYLAAASYHQPPSINEDNCTTCFMDICVAFVTKTEPSYQQRLERMTIREMYAVKLVLEFRASFSNRDDLGEWQQQAQLALTGFWGQIRGPY